MNAVQEMFGGSCRFSPKVVHGSALSDAAFPIRSRVLFLNRQYMTGTRYHAIRGLLISFSCPPHYDLAAIHKPESFWILQTQRSPSHFSKCSSSTGVSDHIARPSKGPVTSTALLAAFLAIVDADVAVILNSLGCPRFFRPAEQAR